MPQREYNSRGSINSSQTQRLTGSHLNAASGPHQETDTKLSTGGFVILLDLFLQDKLMTLLDQLTKRQFAVFDFIRDKINNRGYGPTVREIGDKFKINSPNGVMCHLRALEKKGLITREPNMSRAIQLAAEFGGSDSMPLAGQVSAGVMLEAVEQSEEVDFGKMFAKDGRFALRVSGDSMIEAQIADGDFVIVQRTDEAENGQMVIAQTDDGQATLKYWFPEKGRIRLQPANSAMEAIYVDSATVVGVVVGVVRQF